jgi:hypothetical protein
MTHRWSGWPHAWCLDCGLEDADELNAVGTPDEVHHVYSDVPHTSQPCEGCSNLPCPEPGSERNDPYARRRKGLQTQ